MSTSCAVSVIVPVCNVQRYLRQCLNSLTEQTLQNIQIICINDGSTDDSLAILKEYALRDPRIEVISKPNAGYGHTMNCGLKAARGEYIGIVESDDFAELDMFEKLYSFAKKYDVDIVKSNYYQYSTDVDPDHCPVVENLMDCRYDQVFCPKDQQNIFLTQPAIWSALYKRDFLEKEDISFLETPGASFQDTSFNFKVFAVAKRVALTKEAYLHYRVDNENSSVKSLKKVFCICDEYRNIWEFARSRSDVFEALKYRIPQIQFGGYMWNLDRLTPGLQYQFYEKIVEEYTGLNREGLLRRDHFDDLAWQKLQSILENPKDYFMSTYGPIDVDKTFLIIAKNKSWKDIQFFMTSFVKRLSTNDEAYIYSVDQDILSDPDLIQLVNTSGSLHIAEGEIILEPIERVDPTMIRGSRCEIVEIGGPEWTEKSGADLLSSLDGPSKLRILANESWAYVSWETRDLRAVNKPLFIPLLFSGFYGSNGVECAPKHFMWISAMSNAVDVKRLKAGYPSSYENFKNLYATTDPKALSNSLFEVFSVLWGRLNSFFHEMEYEDRLLCTRPQLADFAAKVVCESQINKPQVSVVIPVYNAEQYLSVCLDSVLGQTGVELEVICIDDGSSDRSLDILNSYAADNECITIVTQFNGGAGAARNRGIEIAKGEFLAFIDPDDTYPSNSVLFDLVRAAKENKAKISGGSLILKYPDGSTKEYFGGEQGYYTIRRNGMYKLSDLQSDYGWIRFMYHRSIFEEGGVRFPEYRWYEDPVFLTRVMEYCDDFCGVSEPVYSYRVDYKEPSWTRVKVRDLMKGVSDNLAFAEIHQLTTLYTSLILRLEHDYYDVIMENLGDIEVLLSLIDIQSHLRLDLLNNVNDNKSSMYLIRPFYNYEVYGTAIVRLARRAEKSNFYKKLQDLRIKRRNRSN